jgi:hypothetical protein
MVVLSLHGADQLVERVKIPLWVTDLVVRFASSSLYAAKGCPV